MVNFSLSKTSAEASKFVYSVLIDQEQDGKFSAVVLGLADCKSSGGTEDEAVSKLQHILQERLKNSKIVTLEIESTSTKNPWIEFAGMYEDNPLFDEVISNIAAYRREIDNQID